MPQRNEPERGTRMNDDSPYAYQGGIDYPKEAIHVDYPSKGHGMLADLIKSTKEIHERRSEEAAKAREAAEDAASAARESERHVAAAMAALDSYLRVWEDKAAKEPERMGHRYD